MAQIESSGKGRTTNVELNLVPFIDLMSVLITFLLISAVWTQVSMLQLGASFAAPIKSNDSQYKPPQVEDLVLRLEVVANGYVLKFGSETKPIPKLRSEYDTSTLFTELKKIKKLFPNNPGIKISISDEIIYENIISTMDAGLKAGFAPELLTQGPN